MIWEPYKEDKSNLVNQSPLLLSTIWCQSIISSASHSSKFPWELQTSRMILLHILLQHSNISCCPCVTSHEFTFPPIILQFNYSMGLVKDRNHSIHNTYHIVTSAELTILRFIQASVRYKSSLAVTCWSPLGFISERVNNIKSPLKIIQLDWITLELNLSWRLVMQSYRRVVKVFGNFRSSSPLRVSEKSRRASHI